MEKTIDQQIDNKSDNWNPGTMIMHLPDKPLWQEIEIKVPDDI